MSVFDRLGPALSSRVAHRRRLQLRARRTQRLVVIVAGSVIAGAAAVLFAKLCDLATLEQARLMAWSRPAALAALALCLPAMAWLTGRVAPEAAGSGIPQIIAAAESQRPRLAADPRISLWTAAWKIVICAVLLLCGASIGREGPTVQVCAAIVYVLGARMHDSPGRRALLIAGGAAGVAAAFNAPIAGVVFAGEELAKVFDKRTNTVVILVVVSAGVAAYALAGNYSYFSQLGAETALGSAWYSAPVVGVVCGLLGGLFSRTLASMIGPLFLAALIARGVSGWVMPEPIYHALSHTWLEPREVRSHRRLSEPLPPFQEPPGT